MLLHRGEISIKTTKLAILTNIAQGRKNNEKKNMTGRTVDRVALDNISDEILIRCEGIVKWFDVTRGFGFATCGQVDGDVLLHMNVLRNFGQSSVPDGASVTFDVQRTARGFQAVEVFAIVPPFLELDTQEEMPEFMQPVPEGTPFLAARVKWFDKAKGFGFANAFGSSEDIFVHAEVLRRFGLADLQPGEAICLRTIDGERGLLAAEVRRWEFYVTPS